jgi:magnesium-transporting ATPase (P-type)
MSKKDYTKWAQLYKEAQERLENREQEQIKVISYLENHMEFLGITGVEDKL